MATRSFTALGQTRDTKPRSRGQALVEFGITLPFLLVVIMGTFQLSYLIYQQYTVLNLAREGANLILRDTTQSSFDVTAAAIQTALAESLPQFNADTRVILSVLQVGPTGGPT